MLESQLAHVASHEWWSYGLTWIHRFYSTTHDLTCKAVVTKVVVLAFSFAKTTCIPTLKFLDIEMLEAILKC